MLRDLFLRSLFRPLLPPGSILPALAIGRLFATGIATRRGANLACSLLARGPLGPLTRPSAAAAAASAPAWSFTRLPVRLGAPLGISGFLALCHRLVVLGLALRRLPRLMGARPVGLLGATLLVTSTAPPPPAP